MSNPVSTTRRNLLAMAGAGAVAASSPALAGRIKSKPLLGVVKSIIAAWEKQDVEGVLTHVTDDVVYHMTSGYRPALVGKAAVRTVLQSMAPVIKTSAWKLFDSAESKDRLFVEGVDEFWTTSGAHVVIPYAGVFQFRGKLIYEWREYYDGRISSEMKNGAPVTAELKALIARPAI